MQKDRKYFVVIFYSSNAFLLLKLIPFYFTAHIRQPTQNGMIILPPPSLPFGGQITHINPTKVDRSVSSKRRSTARHSNRQSQTTTSTT